MARWIAALALLVAGVGCAPSPLNFRVIDDETGKPVSNARLTRESSRAVTELGRSDDEGYVRAVVVGNGDQLVFQKRGYAPAKLEVQSKRLKRMDENEGPSVVVDAPFVHVEHNTEPRVSYISAHANDTITVPLLEPNNGPKVHVKFPSP